MPLIDPADIEVDPEALRLVAARRVRAPARAAAVGVATDGTTKVLRIAMADPTDTSAILELEQLAHCEIEVTALPLSAIEELVDKGYKRVLDRGREARRRPVVIDVQDPHRPIRTSSSRPSPRSR